MQLSLPCIRNKPSQVTWIKADCNQTDFIFQIHTLQLQDAWARTVTRHKSPDFFAWCTPSADVAHWCFCLHGIVKPCWLACAPINKAPSLSVPRDAAAHFAWSFHILLIFALTGCSKCQKSASFQSERLNLPEIICNSLCRNPKYLLIWMTCFEVWNSFLRQAFLWVFFCRNKSLN